MMKRRSSAALLFGVLIMIMLVNMAMYDIWDWDRWVETHHQSATTIVQVPNNFETKYASMQEFYKNQIKVPTVYRK